MLVGLLTTWLTPIWILSVGIAAGLVLLLIVFGLIYVVSPQNGARILSILGDGTMQYVLYCALFLSGFALVAAVQMPVERVANSLARMTVAEQIEREITVPPLTERQELDISFRGAELQSYELESTHDLILGASVDGQYRESGIKIQGGETTRWKKVPGEARPFTGYVSKLYLTNYAKSPATISLKFNIDVEYPQVYSIPVAAVGMLALFGLYFGLHWAAPKVAAIADTTSKHAVSQPIFLLLLGLGAFLLIAFIYIPYNTFGEDVKMLQLTGMTLIMVLAIVVALWTASVSVADEIDGKTALTLLSKPIGRRQFIFGKYLGIIWPTVLMFIVLGTLFLVTTSYKVVYDARESSQQAPQWQMCFSEVIQAVPGLLLAFMETILLAAVSVAISTRLPMLANLIICFSVYVLGHLGPTLVQAAPDFEIVRFFGMLVATVFPVLEYFKIEGAIVGSAPVPVSYLGWALLYCIAYSSIAMLLALLLFEDRDLA